MTDQSRSLVSALLLLLLGVSRLGVLRAAGRRFCCCRLLRTDDRGGNPRFDINLSTPLSERCSPSFPNVACVNTTMLTTRNESPALISLHYFTLISMEWLLTFHPDNCTIKHLGKPLEEQFKCTLHDDKIRH